MKRSEGRGEEWGEGWTIRETRKEQNMLKKRERNGKLNYIGEEERAIRETRL